MRRAALIAVALFMPFPALAQTVVYVNANRATGADDGTSWANAYRGPQALKRAMDLTPSGAGGEGSQIWVAQGRYTPAPPDGPRRAAFIMKSGVAIYGGFTGIETSLDQRSPTGHPVILSGDLNNDDAIASRTAENAVHLIHAIDTDHTAILDGVTIQDGFAWGLVDGRGIEDTFGANLMIENSDAVFTGCVISDCFARDGAGAHLDGDSDPTFTDCVFTRCTGQDLGGAVRVAPGGAGRFQRCDFLANRGGLGAGLFNGWILGSSTSSMPVIEDCRFIDNFGDIGGGAGPGIFDGSAATIIRTEFRRNLTGAGGGGLFCAGTGTTVISCVFTGNEGSFDGGDAIRVESGVNRFANCAFFAQGGSGPGGVAPSGITCWITGGRSDFANCTFANNNLGAVSPTFGVTALFFGTGATPTIATVDNCIFWNNRNPSGFGQSAAIRVQSGTVSVNRSFVQGWTGSIPGTGSSAANPLFVDIDGFDGVAGTPDDDLRLAHASPAIDASSSAPLLAMLAASSSPFTDAAGSPRFVDDAFTADTGLGEPPLADRGAYEFQPTCPADLTADGIVDFSDYLAFLNYFDASDLRADFNHDTFVDFADYLEFLNQFDAGC